MDKFFQDDKGQIQRYGADSGPFQAVYAFEQIQSDIGRLAFIPDEPGIPGDQIDEKRREEDQQEKSGIAPRQNILCGFISDFQLEDDFFHNGNVGKVMMIFASNLGSNQKNCTITITIFEGKSNKTGSRRHKPEIKKTGDNPFGFFAGYGSIAGSAAETDRRARNSAAFGFSGRLLGLALGWRFK